MKLLRTLTAAWREMPRVLPLMRDARVPLVAKIATVGVAVLIVSPLDLLGDIPVLGLVDDVALLAFVVHVFVSFAERALAKAPIVEHNVTPEGALLATRTA